MEIHHIFIFSNNQGKEADELVNFGLIEGSYRIHKGQGTQNRKFYFGNFYLEIPWVYNEIEFRNPKTDSIKLYERANHLINGYSPFGLCLVNSEKTDFLFKDSIKYQPEFIPAGMSFDVITNEAHPYLPWIFRPPYGVKETNNEPTNHKPGMQNLTKVIFQIPVSEFKNEYSSFFYSESGIVFQFAETYGLILEFDFKKRGLKKVFHDIPLTIEY